MYTSKTRDQTPDIIRRRSKIVVSPNGKKVAPIFENA
jgi:hypothetical protein